MTLEQTLRRAWTTQSMWIVLMFLVALLFFQVWPGWISGIILAYFTINALGWFCILLPKKLKLLKSPMMYLMEIEHLTQQKRDGRSK